MNRNTGMSPAPAPLRDEPESNRVLPKMDFWGYVILSICCLGLIVLFLFDHFCPNCK